MTTNANSIATAIALLLAAAVAACSEPQAAPTLQAVQAASNGCPANYELYGEVCISNITGDVVYPSTRP